MRSQTSLKSASERSFQVAAAIEAETHEASDHSVRLAERQTLPHQVVGKIGGRREAAAGSLSHAYSIDAERSNHDGYYVKARCRRIYAVEQRFLVFLQVAVVGQRQALP